MKPHWITTETISGSLEIAQHSGFSRLLDKMKKGMHLYADVSIDEV
jgi:hypothetical protein